MVSFIKYSMATSFILSICPIISSDNDWNRGIYSLLEISVLRIAISSGFVKS